REWPRLWPEDAERSHNRHVSEQRHCDNTSKANAPCDGPPVAGLRLDVRDMHDAPLEKSHSDRGAGTRANRKHVARKDVEHARAGVIERDELTEFAVEPHQSPVHAVANLHCTRRDRVEDWLHVDWRS